MWYVVLLLGQRGWQTGFVVLHGLSRPPCPFKPSPTLPFAALPPPPTSLPTAHRLVRHLLPCLAVSAPVPIALLPHSPCAFPTALPPLHASYCLPLPTDWYATWCHGCERSFPEVCKVIMDPELQK